MRECIFSLPSEFTAVARLACIHRSVHKNLESMHVRKLSHISCYGLNREKCNFLTREKKLHKIACTKKLQIAYILHVMCNIAKNLEIDKKCEKNRGFYAKNARKIALIQLLKSRFFAYFILECDFPTKSFIVFFDSLKKHLMHMLTGK